MLPKTWIARSVAAVCTVLALALLAAVAWREWLDDPGDSSVALGGPYTLTDTAGKTVTPDTFGDRYRLIYFGYTHCPGVCPQTLTAMTRALNSLAESGPKLAERVTPVFITIDPARDDRARVRTYLKNFHPRFVGLTGTADQIAAAAQQFRVSYKKMPPEAFDKGTKKRRRAEAAGYLMQHSSYVFLMGPDGEYVDHVSTNANATQMMRMLKKNLDT